MIFKKETIVGLDIGASSVKLVELKKSGRGLELVRASVIEIKRDLAEAGKTPGKEEAIASAISELLAAEKIRRGWAVISLSGQSAFVKFLKLPRMAVKKIGQIIRYEAQQQVPFPVDEVVWSYQVLPGAGAEIDVALVAVKTNIIEDLLGLVEGARLDIEAVNTSPLAFYNLFSFQEEEKKPAILLDIGARTTNVIISQGPNIWTRSLPIAGDDITRAIASAKSLKFSDAERLKIEKGIATLSSSEAEAVDEETREISSVIEAAVANLADEVLRSTDYFRSQFNGVVLEKLLLTGGGSRLKNLTQLFENNLGLSVKRFEPLGNIVTTSSPPPGLDKIKDRLGVALGLALQGQMPVVIGISLLPPLQLKTRIFKKKKNYIVLGEVLTIMLAITAAWFSLVGARIDNARLRALERDFRQYGRLEQQAENITSQLRPNQLRLAAFQQIDKERSRWLGVLDELTRILPPRMWLTSATIQPGAGAVRARGAGSREEEDEGYYSRETRGVSPPAKTPVPEVKAKEAVGTLTIAGRTTASLSSMNSFKEDLEKSPYFSGVQLISADYLSSESGGTGEWGERRAPVSRRGEEEEKIVVFEISLQVEIPR